MSAHLKPRELCELAGPGDADLLARYTATGDPDVFASLVRRHARTVLGACRRVLADAHAAEDAFQATFLQLARKAGGLRHPSALPGWLYRTARRTALRHRPPPPPPPPDRPPVRDPLDVLTARELLAAVEAEIARLPRAYRLPLVLCYLDGLPRDAAADRLGVPPGVFRGRLDRGRERLRAALTRRGLAPAAALGAFAPAPVAADLVARTVSVCAKGERASAAVAALAAGRVGLPTTAGLAVGLLVVLSGLALVAAPAQTDPPPPPAAPQPRTDLFGDPLPDGAMLRLGTTRSRADIAGFGARGRGPPPGPGVRRVRPAGDRLPRRPAPRGQHPPGAGGRVGAGGRRVPGGGVVRGPLRLRPPVLPGRHPARRLPPRPPALRPADRPGARPGRERGGGGRVLRGRDPAGCHHRVRGRPVGHPRRQAAGPVRDRPGPLHRGRPEPRRDGSGGEPDLGPGDGRVRRPDDRRGGPGPRRPGRVPVLLGPLRARRPHGPARRPDRGHL
ncbi:sigma-70 family RNA polymerase sigma factor, partial [bacterium]|nr:sigma-70 family RNA polymerase sigma factor [bacterium]